MTAPACSHCGDKDVAIVVGLVGTGTTTRVDCNGCGASVEVEVDQIDALAWATDPAAHPRVTWAAPAARTVAVSRGIAAAIERAASR